MVNIPFEGLKKRFLLARYTFPNSWIIICSTLILLSLLCYDMEILVASPTSKGDNVLFLIGNEYYSYNYSFDINAMYTASYAEIKSLKINNGSQGLDCPRNMSIWLDDFDNEIYRFQGVGYGEFGKQNSFSDDSLSKVLVFSRPWETQSISFLLPENASCSMATVDIKSIEKVLNWTSPTKILEYYNGSEFPILTMGQISADFIDIDNDELKDMIKGGWSPIYNSTTYCYKNVGTKERPIFLYNSDYSRNISMEIKANPRFVDIDNDNDYDLFIGQYNGKIDFYRNNGTISHPIWNLEPFFETYFFGYEPCPAFADMDEDGDKDLIVGQQSITKTIQYYMNIGNSNSFKFVDTDIFQGLELDEINFPSLTDFDFDGDMDLFVGHWDQRMSLFENIGNSTTPRWGSRQLIFQDSELGYYLTPVFSDLNNDGYDDIIIGAHNGVLHYFQRDIRWPQQLNLRFKEKKFNYNISESNNETLQINITDGIVSIFDYLSITQNDSYTSLKEINITASIDNVGSLIFSNLSILYDLTIKSLDYSSILNKLANTERMKEHFESDFNSSFIFYSATSSSISFNVILDSYFPLQFNRIQDTFEIDEDSKCEALIDLYNYINYKGILDSISFSIISENDTTNIYISHNRYVAIDNSISYRYNNWTGVQYLQIKAIDKDNYSAYSNLIAIYTRQVNDAPIIISIPKTDAFEDKNFQYQIIARDAENDVLSFNIIDGPQNAIINARGLFTWIPYQCDIGLHTVVISVSDYEYNCTQRFLLRVFNVNDAPYFIDIPILIITRGEIKRIKWTEFVVDVDTQFLQLICTNQTPYVLVDGIYLIIYFHNDTNFHEYIVELTVFDEMYNNSAQLNILISDNVENTLRILPIPEFDVFINKEYFLDLRPFIIFNLDYNLLGIISNSVYVKSDNCSLRILIPGNINTSLYSCTLGIYYNNYIVYTIIQFNVLNQSIDIIKIPTQYIQEDTEYTIQLAQYFSNGFIDKIQSVLYVSDYLVSFDMLQVKVQYPIDIQENIDCQFLLKNSSIYKFTIPITVLPIDDMPILLKPIPNIIVLENNILEINLLDYFSDEENDALFFSSSSNIIKITENGKMIVNYRVKYSNKSFLCRINVIEKNNLNSTINSNEFLITFEESSKSTNFTKIVIILIFIIIIVLVYTIKFRKKPESPELRLIS